MKKWTTIIYAKDPCSDGEVVEFNGPVIEAFTARLAHEYCQNNGLGYCYISDELAAEIPCKPGTLEPDWDKMVDYEDPQNN